MSENSEQVTDEQTNVQPISHRRILSVMAIVILAESLLSFIFVSVSFGVGVLIGGILSFVNYYWLKQSLRILFEKALTGEQPRYSAAGYFLRYLTFGAILALIYLTKTVPVAAVIWGLASFALVVTIEGLIRLFKSFF